MMRGRQIRVDLASHNQGLSVIAYVVIW